MLRHLLRRRRFELGLSQAQVVARTGLSVQTIVKIEIGRIGLSDRKPTYIETLEALSYGLCIPLDELRRARNNRPADRMGDDWPLVEPQSLDHHVIVKAEEKKVALPLPPCGSRDAGHRRMRCEVCCEAKRQRRREAQRRVGGRYKRRPCRES